MGGHWPGGGAPKGQARDYKEAPYRNADGDVERGASPEAEAARQCPHVCDRGAETGGRTGENGYDGEYSTHDL